MEVLTHLNEWMQLACMSVVKYVYLQTCGKCKKASKLNKYQSWSCIKHVNKKLAWIKINIFPDYGVCESNESMLYRRECNGWLIKHWFCDYIFQYFWYLYRFVALLQGQHTASGFRSSQGLCFKVLTLTLESCSWFGSFKRRLQRSPYVIQVNRLPVWLISAISVTLIVLGKHGVL